jgi:hypothetical protein
MMEMRQTVGGEATETVENGEQPADPR